ncbi:MAG: aromatic ring-hydroxylating dioxygenase subunit alpha [Actinomycetota bacterium]|nr:aromatic ring-hydroxylating dioxygenase subunit alpha [Actinomycetota bacterium]
MATRIRHDLDLALDPHALAATLQPLEHATMLPPASFADPSVLDWELENLFAGWVCFGHVSSVTEPGSYLMRELGRSSVFVITGDDGEPRAFLNACRHRGSRLVQESEGSVRRRLRCPYHAWSYDLDGSLAAAPHMDGVEDFDRSCFGLLEVRSTVVGGLVLVDLSGESPDPAAHVGELADLLELYRLASLARVEGRSYEVEANWKAIAENYNECLHCPGVHPELNALSDYRSGESVEGAGAWCGGSMRLNEGAETMGRGEGRASARPPIEGLPADEVDAVYYFALFPNALLSLHPDYVMLHTLWPREVDRTEVVCEWFFEPATIARADFDPSDAVDFWDQVNREDWRVCELTQKGVRTRGYVPGRYSAEESDVHAFDAMVAERYMEALNGSEEVAA